MTAPKLRFKEFDEDWNLSTLANISSIITGSTPSTSNREYYDGEFLFVSPADIQENRYVEKTKTTLTANGFSKCRHIPENSVLFVCIGSTIGKVAQNKVICATNQQINAVIPNKGYSSDFLYVLLEKLAPSIKLNAGVQAVPLINKTEFGKTLLNLPISDEQTKIATFLSAVDEKISQLMQKYELLSQYKQGMMQKLFSQQLRFKADDGSEFGEWEDKVLGDVIKFHNGKGHENNVDPNGEFILINSKFVSTDMRVFKKVTACNQKVFDDCLVMVMSDVPNGKAIAKVLYIEDGSKYALNQRIGMFVFNKINHPKFFQYQLNRHKYYLAFDSGVGQTNLKKEEVLSCPIFVPCLAEQTKIANFLSAIDQKIEVVAQQIEQAKKWKKGLLQQMFV